MGMDRCSRCDWRFEHPSPVQDDSRPGTASQPLIVAISPDPFDRRQVARWILGAFEVVVLASVTSLVLSAVGWILASVVSQAIGNDAIGTFITGAFWSSVFGLAGAYGTLRLLAR